jgi:tetratricopeptide (TPR) repeat protein
VGVPGSGVRSEEILIAVAVDRDKVLQAAQKLVEKKRYDKAVVEYQKLVADDPKDVRTLLKIGDLFLKMEQHVDAITTYERVGQFYSTQGFALKAIAVYKQIREIIHKHVPHMEDRFGYIVPKLAEIYTQLNLTSDALATYDEVATRLQRAGRDRDAIDIFKKIVDLDPQNPLPYLRLAEAFVRVRDLDNAITRFGTAAEILLKLGRRDDALKVVERLLQHRADPRFARTAAEIYLERAQPADAMAALTKLQISFKDNPKDLETLALLARAFDKLGQPAKAIEVQKESARIAKDAGKTDQFVALVTSLALRAPNDEGVRALVAQKAALSAGTGPTPPPPSVAVPSATASAPMSVDPRSSIDIEVDEVVVEEEESVNSEAPFALRPSYGQVAIPVAPASTSGAPKPAAALDPAQRLRQIIAQAEAFRRNKDYDQAVALLIEAVDELPASRELRERLCDTLIEAGEQDEAIRQMLGFARWLSGGGDVDSAAQLLDEILLLEPEQAEAIAMLRELGYAVGPEAYGDAGAPAAPASMPAAAPPPSAHPYPGAGGSGPYDPNAPLPSYDLEEISAVEVLSHRPGPPSHAPRAAFTPSQLDDPFGNDAPLPSFDIEEAPAFMALPSLTPAAQPSYAPPAQPSYAPPAQPSYAPPGQPSYAPPAQPPYAAPDQPSYAPAPSPSIPPYAARLSEPPAQLDEEALEEVEFFASHGMFDEARALLDEQLARLPNNRLLLERKRELEAQATGDGSGTRAVPRPSAPPQNGAEDRSFDIAASLDALDALDAGPPPQVYAQPESDQVSVESVFEQFKAGVAAQISESDAATHYDLGVAYKEMGLYTDAISEFELASRDPGRECVCQSMVGMIYLQLGNVEAGIDAFIRGLHASVKTREQELALTYEIGDSYESLRATDQALYYFQRVARIDPGYADMRGSVSERIRRLEPARPVAAPRVAVGAESMGDEFDAALDDLLDDKLP